jgi:hypothetical protein
MEDSSSSNPCGTYGAARRGETFKAGFEDYCEREVDEVEGRAAGCTSISAPGETTRRAYDRGSLG